MSHEYAGMESWPQTAKTCRERLVEENAALLAELAGRERPARYAPDYSEIEGTSVFIQWKGTDVCLDFWCECGGAGHVDGMFVHSVRCPGCGKAWTLPHTIALVESDEFDAERAVPVEED